MKIIRQSHEIITSTADMLKIIELAGRVCYKSEGLMSSGSAEKFVDRAMKAGHHSIIEHAVMSVRFITDRGVTHELVRHRLMSYSQESTRYCNYTKGKFGSEITVIEPIEFYEDRGHGYHHWVEAMNKAEECYVKMIDDGCSPQLARAVLPNSLKTEIIATGNIREWRHILSLRTSEFAHPQIADLMRGLLMELKDEIPILFYDLL